MKDYFGGSSGTTPPPSEPVPGGESGFSNGGFFGSDERMKENIKFVGKKKGHNIYTWNWKDEAKQMGWDKFPTIGVLAQEVMKYMPEAVIKDENGYYKVNYGVL